MTFKKLALATAIATLPMAAMAVDSLDDSSLGGVSGQDGIRVSLDLNLTGLTTIVHDQTGIDGYASDLTVNTPASGTAPITVKNNAGGFAYFVAGPHASGAAPIAYDYENAGAIRIVGTSVQATGATIEIDAGSSAQTLAGGVLNINVNLPSATIVTGSISVGNSNRDDAVTAWGGTNFSADLISSSTLVLGNVDLNIQLGEEPQGNMIRVDTTITGGLSVSGFAMNDVGGAVNGGSISAGNILVNDAGAGLNLTNVVVGIDVDEVDGLVVNLIGLGAGGMDVFVEDVRIGTTTGAMIGDIEMSGLNLAGTVLRLNGK